MCYSFLTILTELIFAMPFKAPLTMSCSSCITHRQSRKRLLILGELIGFFFNLSIKRNHAVYKRMRNY